MANADFKNAMDVFDQLIAQQQAIAAQKPQGIFGNVDPVMLGLAQGFLSPTKTGGFGESIGLGLAGAQGPLESIRKRQMDAQNKIQELQLARAKMQMEEPLIAARAAYYSSGGSRGAPLSPTERRRTLESDIADLENSDAERLGITEDQRLDLIKQKLREKLQLDKLIDSENKTQGGDSVNVETKNTPPKEYPDARLGTNPKTGKQGWFVVRDGKTYEVQ